MEAHILCKRFGTYKMQERSDKGASVWQLLSVLMADPDMCEGIIWTLRHDNDARTYSGICPGV